MTNPYDISRRHGPHPGRYLNLASGDGILVMDIQATVEAIASSEGCGVEEAEARGASVLIESVKRPRAARELYRRLRDVRGWETCPHGYATTMSLSAAGAQRIGPFLVRAPWQEPEAGALDIVIRPGLSFGLGTHATTRLPLQELPAYVGPGCRAADVGCGSGVLSVAMARLGAREVAAVDVDAGAVSEAVENVRRNGVVGIVTTVRTGSASALEGEFDVIVANMGGAPTVIEIAPDVSAHLVPGGAFLASGIYGDDDEAAARVADGVSAALAPLGLVEERRDMERCCVGIAYRKAE